MRRAVNGSIGLVVVLALGGLLATYLVRAQRAARTTVCANHLRQIGLAVWGYHDTYRHFPSGTVAHSGLSPERRLSWIAQIWPAYIVGGVMTCFDHTRAWDAPEHCPPHCQRRNYTDRNEAQWDEHIVGDLNYFLCPANPMRNGPHLPGPTHYLGIAGVGPEAAELPLADPRAGFFGYDRVLRDRDIKDGTGTTLMTAEALNGGPWTAGGVATVRGLAIGVPYVGDGGQFASRHGVTNVGFADASVRPLSGPVAPQLFAALATIAGSEGGEPP